MKESEKETELKEKNNINETENNKINKEKKLNFFKKVGYSITKIEKYPEMSTEGFGKASTYIIKMVALIAIVISLGIIYQTYNLTKDAVNYLKNDFPDFLYSEGTLNVYSEEPIIISEENSQIGKIIVDTKVEDEQTINNYINQLNENGIGIIVLKNKLIVKSTSVTGTINYDYKQTLGGLGITEFNKEDFINHAMSMEALKLYVAIFIIVFLYSLSMYFFTTLVNAIFLTLFGYLTTKLARIKMRFVAIFNMAIYALTLSILLNIIYIAVNIFIDFNIEYFQVMYISVATIYLVSAIFLLKSEFIKRQMELIKISESEAIITKQLEPEIEEEKDSKKEEKENKKEKKEQGDKEENEDNNIDEEPKSSNV